MPGGNVFHGAGLLTDDQIRNAILIPEKPASAPIGDYSLGESVFYKSYGAAGYPMDDQGTVRTSKTSVDTAHQTFFPNDIDNLRQYERYWEGGLSNWTAWKQHGHDTLTTPTFSGDLNTISGSGFWRISRADVATINTPPQNSGEHAWLYLTQIEHSPTYRIQTVWDFNCRYSWMRRLYNGVWEVWAPGPVRPKYVEVTRLNNLPCANGAWTSVLHGTINHNPDGMRHTDGYRLTAPEDGTYLLVFSGRWAANNTGTRIHEIVVEGTSLNDQDRRNGVSSSGFHCTVLAHLAAGTTSYTRVYQNSGATLDLQGPNLLFSMSRLR